MAARYVLLLVSLCAMVIAFVPRAGTGTPEKPSPIPVTAPASATPEQARLNWYGGGHSLQRAGDGHFYADATVAGMPVRLMVDTGASVVALTADDAAAAGLHWDEADISVIGRGASGDVYGVPATLSEIDVGGIVERGVPAVIIPEGLDVSLLGQSYLSRVGSVEISNDRLILGAQ